MSSEAITFPHQLVLFLPDHLPLSFESLVRRLFKEVKAVSRAEYLVVLSTQTRLVGNQYSTLFSRRDGAVARDFTVLRRSLFR